VIEKGGAARVRRWTAARAAVCMESVPEQHERTVDSDAAAQLRKVKHDLTLKLFLQDGTFWQAIKQLRHRWNITPTTQLPPRGLGSPPHPPNWAAPYQSSDWIHLSTQWGYDLDKLVFRVVPERFRNLDYYLLLWREFFAVCVLFDPPDTELPAFAEYGGPRPYRRDTAEEKFLGAPRAFFPAVKEMRDWAVAEDMEREHWHAVLNKISERLKPRGIDLGAMIREAESELQDELGDIDARNPFRFYIEVDDYTTEADVRQAFRMLRTQKGIRLKGTPGRDSLVAVQCAILYDRHNRSDPTDKRRRKWTYKRLAEEFELASERAAKEYVAIGRKILEENRVQ
jgi:hypothetical protein